MDSKPKISIVMVDGSFRESFHSIEFFCNQTLASEDFELIWVEYYNSVQNELQAQVERYPNAKIIKLERDGVYHSSYCFNAGIVAARGEIIVIPDADVVVEPHFLETVWQEHQANEKLVMYLHRFNEEYKDHVKPITLEHLKKVTKNTSWIGNLGGCITIRKKWLLQINGYEQHPVFGTGFHANGYDINMRLRNLGLHVMWHPSLYLYHAWHPFTSEGSPNYNLQHHVVHYRGINLITDAFNGIDESRNIVFPPALQNQLDELEKASTLRQQASKSLLKKISTVTYRARTKVKSTLGLFTQRETR